MSTSQGSHRAGHGGRRVEPLPPPAEPNADAPKAVAPGAVASDIDAPDVPDGTRPPPGRAADDRTGPRRRHRGTRRPLRSDGLRRLLPQALVIAVLAGGTSAFLVADKAVRLSIDGVPRTLHTFAGDVGELLADEGVAVGAHDIVAPALGAALADGDEVVVRYGRPVTLTLDGQRRRVWTTARTVEGTLRQFGVRAEGAALSASRSQPISRRGLTLDVRTERTLTLRADGRRRTVRTTAATVRELLGEAGVVLHGNDTTSVPPGSFPRDGQTVTVLRITVTRQVRDEAVPYRVVRIPDPRLAPGTEAVDEPGRKGVRRVVRTVRTVNGVARAPEKVSEELIRAPRTRRVRVGTEAPSAPPSGTGRLNWGALARCESGGRPDAVDPSGTYGGLYQFDTRTWHAVGGSGRPQDAPAAEQTYRAKKLYAQRGPSPWPTCGRRLYR
ncbi:ubiquitin-like domain-containing protein [Streptomyces sp. NPDC059176]|uniref:ubiquitin-like domain-containing protein n=1 Tax=unclassified Streptomyces TaxID=2593676 RepID=UPI0036C6C749